MNKKHKKIIAFIGIVISVILYSLYILYSNKTHQIFILKDISYNNLLTRYNTMANTIMRLFTISLHLVACYVFIIYKHKILKGIFHLALLNLLVFFFCIVIEKVLNYYRFDVFFAIIQFTMIMMSTLLFYLICYISYKLKNKYFKHEVINKPIRVSICKKSS